MQNQSNEFQDVLDKEDKSQTFNYYDMQGKEYSIELQNTYFVAKKSYNNDTGLTRYWAKKSTFGQDAGQLFNQLSPLFDIKTVHRKVSQSGKEKYEYKSINKECFELYIQFLQTKNLRFIRQAERCF